MTVPAGSSRVMYRVRAVRSTAKGEWASFNVNFGVSASDATLIRQSEAFAGSRAA